MAQRGSRLLISGAWQTLLGLLPGGLVNAVSSKNAFDARASIRMQGLRRHLIQYHLVKSREHNVLQYMFDNNTAGRFLWLRLLAVPLRVYGALVGRVRRRSGTQVDEEW